MLQRSLEKTFDVPLQVGGAEVVTSLQEKFCEKDDPGSKYSYNSSSLSGKASYLTALSRGDNRVPVSAKTFDPPNESNHLVLSRNHPERKSRRHSGSRDINDCLENETHQGDGKDFSSDTEAPRCRVRVRIGVTELERHGRNHNQHDSINHAPDHQDRSDHYTCKKKMKSLKPITSGCSNLMPPGSLDEVDPTIKHIQVQRLSSASCNGNNERQAIDTRYGASMPKQPREFDNGLNCKRSRNNHPFNDSGGTKDRNGLAVSSSSKHEHPKYPLDHTGSSIGKRGNPASPSLVPSLARQYDRYGNPV